MVRIIQEPNNTVRERALKKIRIGKAYSELTDAEAMEIYPVLSVSERKRLLIERYGRFIETIVSSINPKRKHRRKITIEAMRRWFIDGCEIHEIENGEATERVAFVFTKDGLKIRRIER